jgi:hypothetical protein
LYFVHTVTKKVIGVFVRFRAPFNYRNYKVHPIYNA